MNFVLDTLEHSTITKCTAALGGLNANAVLDFTEINRHFFPVVIQMF